MVYEKQNWENLPNETTPISAERLAHMETQYDEAVATSKEYTDQATDPRRVVTGASSVEFKRYPEYDVDVFTYRGDPSGVRKLVADGTRPDGSLPYNSQVSPLTFSKTKGLSIVTNCDAATGGSNPRVRGLNIAEGVPYSDFEGEGSTGGLVGANVEALLLMRDGSFRVARRVEGKSAAQYVSEGAWSSFGYGPVLVSEGADTRWWDGDTFSGFKTQRSARLIFGGDPETSTYKILLVEGKSNEYGIEGETISTAALREGLRWAVNLDGGGTVQGVWGGSLVHPSSDPSGERITSTFISFNAPPSNPYDSGLVELPPATGVSRGDSSIPALSVRRTGDDVEVYCNALVNTPPAEGAWGVLQSGPIPPRYRTGSTFLLRGTLSAGAGQAAAVSVDSSWMLNARKLVYTPGALGVYGALRGRSAYARTKSNNYP